MKYNISLVLEGEKPEDTCQTQDTGECTEGFHLGQRLLNLIVYSIRMIEFISYLCLN